MNNQLFLEALQRENAFLEPIKEQISQLYRESFTNNNTFSEVDFADYFDQGSYFFSKNHNEMLHGLFLGSNRMQWYDLNHRYIESTTKAKSPEMGSWKPCSTTVNSNYVDLIGDNSIWLDKETQFTVCIGTREYPKFSSNRHNTYYLIDELVIRKTTTYTQEHYRGYSRAHTSYAIYLDGEFIAINHLNDIGQYLTHFTSIGGDDFNNLTKSKKSIKTLKHSNSVYFIDGQFYIEVSHATFERLRVSVPAQHREGMYYFLNNNCFTYYIDATHNGQLILSDEVAQPIGNEFVLLTSDGLVFRDNEYYKYGNIVYDKASKITHLSYREKHWDIDEKLLNLQQCEYPVVKTPPEKSLLFFNSSYIYFIDENENLSIFHKQIRKFEDINILNSFKYFKYLRKNTCFALLTGFENELFYCDKEDPSLYSMSLEGFDITSIHAVSMDCLFIKSNEGESYIITGRNGLVKLLFPLKEYESFNTPNCFIGILKYGAGYQLNTHFIHIKSNKLYWNNVFICDHAYKMNSCIQITLKQSILNGNDAAVTIDLISTLYRPIYLVTSYQLKRSTSTLFEYSFNNEHYVASLKDNTILKNKGSIQSLESPIIQLGDTDFYINGYAYNLPTLAIIKKADVNFDENSGSIYSEILKKAVFDENLSKEQTLDIVENLINLQLIEYANEKGLSIAINDLKWYPQYRDLVQIIANLSRVKANIERRAPSFKDVLFKHISDYIKHDADFQETDFFKQSNLYNERCFSEAGISIEKFNNYSNVLHFKATNGKDLNLKSTLTNSLYHQFSMIIGSRLFNKPGILQLKDCDQITALYDSCLNDYFDIGQINEKEQKLLIKEVNKWGCAFFKLLKKYNLKMNLIENELFIEDVRLAQCSYKKILQIANEMQLLAKKTISRLNECNLNPYGVNAICKLLNWSIRHIEDDFKDITFNKEITEKNFSIQLWNRKDLLNNLLQGTRTHCCIAIDRSNLYALVEYIYNRNIVLVEILNEGKVIGQAFVYIGQTTEFINYRYDYRKHLFMVIDNVELNNTFTLYKTEIAKQLQYFMLNYQNYVSTKISDVLLGTSYNDIDVPYPEFMYQQEIKVLGTSHYRDSTSSFYKFI